MIDDSDAFTFTADAASSSVSRRFRNGSLESDMMLSRFSSEGHPCNHTPRSVAPFSENPHQNAGVAQFKIILGRAFPNFEMTDFRVESDALSKYVSSSCSEGTTSRIRLRSCHRASRRLMKRIPCRFLSYRLFDSNFSFKSFIEAFIVSGISKLVANAKSSCSESDNLLPVSLVLRIKTDFTTLINVPVFDE